MSDISGHSQSTRELSLSQFGWEWREEAKNSSWSTCETFPTVIHHELQAAGKIEDPFVGENERRIQWVGWKDWSFKTSFPTPENTKYLVNAFLVFDGLDTFATVKLNGSKILESDNMFVPYRVDVQDKLRPETRVNELVITFDSAMRRGKELEAKYGRRMAFVRESSRLYVRKSQYHYGWDWGPTEVTAGPYKDIRLELFDARIDDLYVSTKLANDLKSAVVTVETTVEGDGTTLDVGIQQLWTTVDHLNKTITLGPHQKTVKIEFEISNPKLWWPAGHGDAPLYIALAKLSNKEGVAHETNSYFGIRSIKLIQRPLTFEPGKTFMFEVNNRPIYICGTNWVPSHNQAPSMTPARYRKWIDVASRGNNNLIRIWGGGLYEDHSFYDACDKQGILVWHDFMTACGNYPAEDYFLKSCEMEVRAQVKRLRNHACIALWCGNNEDFMIAEFAGVKFDIEDTTGPWKDTALPSRIIYMKLWPDIVKEMMPETPYWPSSPFGGKSSNDPTEGDVHQWSVWHHLQLPYQQYPRLGGRLVSEFGMHAFPNQRTVKVFAPENRSRYPNSRIMDSHNKSSGSENKMGRYLWENFRMPTTMDSFIYLSQLLQCEALDHALIPWRREFRGEGEELNAGAIIWQLNDSNPTTSWSLVDYYFRPKPAFYTTRRAFGAVTVGITRTPVWHFFDEDKPFPTNIPMFEIWGSNFHMESQEVQLRLRMYDLTSRKEIDLGSEARQHFTLRANCSTELRSLQSPPEITEDSYVILSAAFHDTRSGDQIARKVSWPEPYRYLDLTEATSVRVTTHEDAIELECGEFPVKGALAYVDPEDGEEPDWEDNMHDLMPGETIRLGVQGLAGRNVHVKHLASIY